MFFEWTRDLDIGVEQMNAEHQRLIAMMNDIYAMTEAGAERGKVAKAIDELAAFAKEHFAREESFMESVNYPGVKQHKEIHVKLLERFSQHVNEFQQGDGTVGKQFFSFLKIWLSSHIQGIDMHYGDHCRQQKRAS